MTVAVARAIYRCDLPGADCISLLSFADGRSLPWDPPTLATVPESAAALSSSSSPSAHSVAAAAAAAASRVAAPTGMAIDRAGANRTAQKRIE